MPKPCLKFYRSEQFDVYQLTIIILTTTMHFLLQEFGLDRFAYYPYLSSYVRIKSEPLEFNGMVSINKEIRDELYREEDYVHWDTDNSSDEEETSLLAPAIKKRKVPSLTALAVRTLFSRRCLGKVPKKLRKVKAKYDIFNMDDDYDVNISNIISNLDEDSNVNYDSDSLLDAGNNVGGDKRVPWESNVMDKDTTNVDSAVAGFDVGADNIDKNVSDNQGVGDNVGKNKNIDANVDKNVGSGLDMLPSLNGIEGNDCKKNGYSATRENNEVEKSDSGEFNGAPHRNESLNENCNSQNSEESTDSHISEVDNCVEENSNHTSSSKDMLDGFNEKINGKNYVTYSEDDKKLLDELDAQIGENANSDKISELDKNSVQNLSMDVPDFNFDP